MNEFDKNQSEVSMKELFCFLFKNWRRICQAALLLGILLGGYKVSSGILSASNSATSEDVIAEYESKLNSYNLQKEATEKQLAATQNLLETETERMESSPLMQLDPSTAVCLTYGMQVTVDTTFRPGVTEDNTDLFQRIVDGYVAKLTDEIMDEAAGELDMESADLAAITEIRGDIYAHRIYIDVYAADKQEASDILGAFTVLLDEYRDAMNEEFGPHTIAQVNERLNQDANQELAEKQLNFINKVTEIKTKLTDLETTSDSLENAEPSTPAVSKSAILKSGIKYGILGVILGGFMMVFFVCVAYLMSDKITKLQEITDRYGIKGLGEFQSDSSQKFLSVIDKWIDKLFGYGHKLSDNEVCQIIAANVRNYMTKDTEKILVTGSANEASIKRITEYLSETIKEVSFEACPDLRSNPRALELLPEKDSVILIEEKGKTTTNDIEAELTIIQNMKKELVGAIMI